MKQSSVPWLNCKTDKQASRCFINFSARAFRDQTGPGSSPATSTRRSPLQTYLRSPGEQAATSSSRVIVHMESEARISKSILHLQSHRCLRQHLHPFVQDVSVEFHLRSAPKLTQAILVSSAIVRSSFSVIGSSPDARLPPARIARIDMKRKTDV